MADPLISLDTEHASAQPGGQARVTVTVTNPGNRGRGLPAAGARSAGALGGGRAAGGVGLPAAGRRPRRSSSRRRPGPAPPADCSRSG